MPLLISRSTPSEKKRFGSSAMKSDRAGGQAGMESPLAMPARAGAPPISAGPRLAAPGRCAYQGCRSGWTRFWKSRTAPIFEGGWTCSLDCSAALIEAAIRRERLVRKEPGIQHRHRIPLGLLMMEQGWITQTQLRRALASQKANARGRIGEWLVRHGAIAESHVARALGLQWSCPVLSTEMHDAGSMAVVMPRLFVDAFGAIPLWLAGANLLYVGFEQSQDRALALALEEMLGLRVECGIVPESDFRAAQAGMLDAKFSPVEMVEAMGEAPAAQVMARFLERERPVASRLVRVHDLLWLRLWLRPQTDSLPEQGTVRDLVCSIVGSW